MKPSEHLSKFYLAQPNKTGVDLMDDIRLDVQEAREAPTAHPQWEFEVN